MTVIIHANALKHKREFQDLIYRDVILVRFEHQPNNGDWIVITQKDNVAEEHYIGFDRTADLLTVYNERAK